MAFFRLFSPLALTWGLLLPLAWAQSPVPDAARVGGPVPRSAAAAPSDGPVDYVSVLARYQPFAEQALASWPDANATVQRIGGWRAYAKEASANPPATPEIRPPQPGTKP